MLKIIYLTLSLFLLLVSHSLSSYDLERSGLYRSWMAPKTIEPFIEAHARQHKHNTMYLFLSTEVTDPTLMSLFETCLVTYCSLVIEEKKYVVDEKLEAKLKTYPSFSIVSANEYRRLSKFSRRMNAILPYRDTYFVGHIRRPFSYFWPVIDMYDSLEKVRLVYPVAADLIDYLFKTNPELTQEKMMEKATINCSKGVNGLELLTLFILHTFGKEGAQDLVLAKKEAEHLQKSFNKYSPMVMYLLMETYQNQKKKKADELAQELYLSGGSAEELNFDSDAEF